MNLQSAVRIVVCDPQPVFRYGLKQFLDTTEHLRVVGEASDPLQAAETVRQYGAHVLVVTTGGASSTSSALTPLSALSREVRCIMVTDGTRQVPPTQFAVAGTLPRESTTRAFLDCIDSAIKSDCWPASQDSVAPVDNPAAAAIRYRLTRRETEVVTAV